MFGLCLYLKKVIDMLSAGMFRLLPMLRQPEFEIEIHYEMHVRLAKGKKKAKEEGIGNLLKNIRIPKLTKGLKEQTIMSKTRVKDSGNRKKARNETDVTSKSRQPSRRQKKRHQTHR